MRLNVELRVIVGAVDVELRVEMDMLKRLDLLVFLILFHFLLLIICLRFTLIIVVFLKTNISFFFNISCA